MLIEVLSPAPPDAGRGPGQGDEDLSSDRLGVHRRGPIEARKAMEGTGNEDAGLFTDDRPAHGAGGESAGQEAAGARVISLHARRLPPDPRQALPDMSKYDRRLNPVTARERSQNQNGQGA